ncbi:GMC oxidoreductase [Xylariaceae sp. FL1651]|nr:GMC oxidoreductase [Xylariaceae sp. FL1651]
MASSFDFIIVGGGTAGLVLACRLSEIPDVQVLVIEAGQDLTSDPRVNMPAMNQSLHGTPSNWRLQTVPQKFLHDRQLKVYGGRVLGGSSALNTFVFVPPSKNQVEAWCALGNPSWSWPEFSRSMSSAYSAQDTPWGSLGHGPLHVSFAAEDTEWPATWRNTISNLGFPVSMNPLSGEICGAHTDPETVHPTEKLRSYAGSAYLEPARSRSNLTVWTDTYVEKIIFDRNTGDNSDPVAIGVQYVQNDNTIRRTVTARKEVILSAGAIHTPRVLELSGVGDPELLQRLEIDVVIDNSYVGENLQNHIYVALVAEVMRRDGFETLDGLLQGDAAALAAAQDALAQGRGPLTGVNTSGSAQMPLPFFSSEAGKQQIDRLLGGSGGDSSEQEQGGKEKEDVEDGLGKATPAFISAHEAFVRSVLGSSTEASAFYSMFPGYMAFDATGNLLPHPGDGLYVTFAVQLAHPLSRGSTHITAASSSAADIEIEPRYLSHAADAEVLARHIQQLVERVKTTEPLASLFVPGGKTVPPAPSHEDEGGKDLSDLEIAKEYVRKACMGAYHFTGTCSQMPREMGGVVDDKGRVYGCRNLRVCDLSIVPIVPRCGSQATAYGLAEHVARMIKSNLGAQ